MAGLLSGIKDVFRLYVSYLKKHKKLYAVFTLCVAFFAVFQIALPWLMGELIQVIQEGNIEEMTIFLVLIVLTLLIEVIYVEFICFDFAARLFCKFYRDSKGDIFKNIQNWDYETHVNKSTGKIVSKIGKLDTALFNYIYQFNFFLFGNALSLVLLLFLISLISPVISIVAVIIIICYLPFFIKLLKFNFTERKKVNVEENILSDILVDNLAGFESVKSFIQEKKEIAKFNEQLDRTTYIIKKADWSYRYLFATTRAIGVLVILAGALVIIEQFRLNQLDLKQIVIIMGYLMQIPWRMLDFTFQLRELVKGYADFENFEELLKIKPHIKTNPKAKALINPEGKIEFSNVLFSYSADMAINDISLAIDPNEQIALVGVSGSGKTTFTKLLMRYYDVRQGSIKIDGIDLRDLTLESLRDNIGLVPQDPAMFNNTIGYNIGYGIKDPDMKKIIKASKDAQIHDFIDSLPEKYKTVVGERGIKLSGGQRQRLAIARMIIKNPKILIFDEATSQLDSESEYLIKDALKNLSKNKTVIIIAHRLSTIINCDRIYVLGKGRVIQTGTHKELLKQKGTYKTLWDIQSGGFEFEE